MKYKMIKEMEKKKALDKRLEKIVDKLANYVYRKELKLYKKYNENLNEYETKTKMLMKRMENYYKRAL
jgi:hypothetical protein